MTMKTGPWFKKKVDFPLSKCKVKIKPKTTENIEQDTTKGQGLGFTR